MDVRELSPGVFNLGKWWLWVSGCLKNVRGKWQSVVRQAELLDANGGAKPGQRGI